MPDCVRQDDEVLGRIEELTGAKQGVGEVWREKGTPAAPSAVHDQDRIRDTPIGRALQSS
jgi:hypothetical protein